MPQGAGVARERVIDEPVAPAVDPLLLAGIEDGLRSLRTAVVLLGLLSVAALGVAVYALIRNEQADRNSASSGHVARLENRIDKLSHDLQTTRRRTSGTPDQSDLTQLQGRLSDKADTTEVRRLERTVAKLQAQVTDSKSNDDTRTAFDQVDQRLNDLSRQVRQLQAKQQTAP